MDTTTDVVPVRQTAAERRSLPDFRDIAEAFADKEKVCRKPVPMRVENPRTFEVSYVGAPCKSTVASVCPACAEQARYLRMTQCREGWHLEDEPEDRKKDPTEHQQALLATRADLFNNYQQTKTDGDTEFISRSGIVEVVASIDAELRDTGLRKRLPPLDPPAKARRVRSTRRRQDVPNLPRRRVSKATIGRQFAGRFRPSMFVTLTLPSYGAVLSDGSPVDFATYDYTRAARDVVFFSNLVDRWIDNLRRVVGYNVQYWGTIEPQKRGAPHLHIALRGAITHKIIQQVTNATYFQAWWPRFDAEDRVYGNDEQMPVWDHKRATFVDPATRKPLNDFEDALDTLGEVDNWEPAHVARFGVQVDSKGILGGTEESSRHIGYMTKYLTKSIGEVLEAKTPRAADHYDRLHNELQYVPCSKKCAVWLRFGIIPEGASDKTVPGRCKGKAHRRSTLGLPGRRVLNSRQWSGKTLPDHKADRAEFVRQLLASVGIEKPDTSHLRVTPVQPGDQNALPRDHLIMAAIAQRKTWRAEYVRAMLAAGPPAAQETSAILTAA
ncbi:helitron helicase-like domain-containing protein [Nocardia sp. NBC_00508]|uniref:replication initiator n=1 Tax=Nocardia sp. NBC_00508 TaxID=2975992 RepID=UPI002E823083|nr:replication initiator [Nocardia sp. NBC_00508]WUD69632.1 helitron helicase-like domain-containing protein [Nocardia sp. NBC_00508]